MDLTTWEGRAIEYDYKGHSVAYWFQKEQIREVVVLIHGFPTASWDWHKIWPNLQTRYNNFAIDMMGFGYSAKPTDYQYSIMDQANLHEEILAHCNIKHIHILAHNYGDTVAQELIARYQDRNKCGEDGLQIRSVCFLNGGLFPETHQPRPIQRLLISPLGRFLSPLLNRKKLKRNLNEIFGKHTQASELEIDEFYSLIDYNNGRNVMYKLIRYMSERKKYRERWVNALIEASFSIRLINGADDPISGSHLTKRYIELVDQADVISLKGIGHYPQTEAPNLVITHYLSFLEKQPT